MLCWRALHATEAVCDRRKKETRLEPLQTSQPSREMGTMCKRVEGHSARPNQWESVKFEMETAPSGYCLVDLLSCIGI